MPFTYLVLGAGMQGTAAACDLARFGDAGRVILADADLDRACAAAARVDRLAGRAVAEARQVDAARPGAAAAAFRGARAVLSAVLYPLNPALARAAVEAGACFCDLGGNTEVVFRELELDAAARAAGVSVVPDCGLAPGLAASMVAFGVAALERCDEVRIRCGGLPEVPRGSLGYTLFFAPEGLTNEYTGRAVALRDGRRVELPTLEEPEWLDVAGVGRLEARTTSGGTSTLPWTYEGRVRDLDYKTLRHPGHFDRMAAMRDLGLFGQEPVDVGGRPVVPRELLHVLLRRHLTDPAARDLVILRVTCRGVRDGAAGEVTLQVLDRADPATGFRAMERTTGFSAAAVCALQAAGVVAPGAAPVERAVPAERLLDEVRRRGIAVTVAP